MNSGQLCGHSFSEYENCQIHLLQEHAISLHCHLVATDINNFLLRTNRQERLRRSTPNNTFNVDDSKGGTRDAADTRSHSGTKILTFTMSTMPCRDSLPPSNTCHLVLIASVSTIRPKKEYSDWSLGPVSDLSPHISDDPAVARGSCASCCWGFPGFENKQEGLGKLIRRCRAGEPDLSINNQPIPHT